MNEMKQALSSLKSPRSSIYANGGGGGSSSTWYDVPTPIIVHNREFDKDTTEDSNNYSNVEFKDVETSSSIRINDDNEDLSDGRESYGTAPDEEIVYQNGVMEMSTTPVKEVESSSCDEQQQYKKRHSSSINVAATTSVETGHDGVSCITFKFLQVDDNNSERSGVTSVNDNTTTTTTSSSTTVSRSNKRDSGLGTEIATSDVEANNNNNNKSSDERPVDVVEDEALRTMHTVNTRFPRRKKRMSSRSLRLSRNLRLTKRRSNNNDSPASDPESSERSAAGERGKVKAQGELLLFTLNN